VGKDSHLSIARHNRPPSNVSLSNEALSIDFAMSSKKWRLKQSEQA